MVAGCTGAPSTTSFPCRDIVIASIGPTGGLVYSFFPISTCAGRNS